MSARKLENSSHRSHTFMPRPPQYLNEWYFGFKQRCFIEFQEWCSWLGLWPIVSPCVTNVSKKLSRAFSFCKHPQLLVFPFRSGETATTTVFPQSHMHSHSFRLVLGSTPTHLFAVSRENLWSIKSFGIPMCVLYRDIRAKFGAFYRSSGGASCRKSGLSPLTAAAGRPALKLEG